MLHFAQWPYLYLQRTEMEQGVRGKEEEKRGEMKKEKREKGKKIKISHVLSATFCLVAESVPSME